MKIAMLGTRGIPGGYSGFETAVEELSKRLVERGHEVVVYCRTHMIKYEDDTYLGVKLVKLPTITNKHLDTFAHTCLSTFHMLAKNRCDVALYFIAGNSPFSFLPRLAGIPTAINVDGMDSRRAKWSPVAKAYLRFAERLAPLAANEVIADSKVIQQYYRDRFRAESVFIPYGAEMAEVPGSEWLDRFSLQTREYILFVGRLVPENRAHVLVEAYNGVKTGKKLVIVGDASYADEYIEKLRTAAGPNVIFTGYIFGEGYRQLSHNAYLAAVPTVVGGTHPVIVEALAAGNCVVVSDHSPNLETIGNAGISFRAADGARDLQAKLQMLVDDPDLVASYRGRARQRAREKYDWNAITDRYEALCRSLVSRRRKNR
ncbi:MAG: glycosyltransferase [Actinobacteria bacterium]|nr:glycosyltransferase [Actinomycetota bacterium]